MTTDIDAFTRHGGALDVARTMFSDAPEPWIDLSTGINPVPYPLGDIPDEAWTRLPDASALAALEQAAGLRYRAPQGTATVAAPGTQAIIQRLPDLCEGRDVRLHGPTYSEYERVFAEARVRSVPSLDRLAGADVAVVVNPNNPDGRLVAPGDLAILAQRVGTLVVDEAFMDALVPSQSLVPRLPASRAIVLRSFGKIYGLPGLRLGFVIAPRSRAEALRRMLGPWPVSGAAISVATRALADDSWLAASWSRLKSDGARLTFPARPCRGRAFGGHALVPAVRASGGPRALQDAGASWPSGSALRRPADLAAVRPARLRGGLGSAGSRLARVSLRATSAVAGLLALKKRLKEKGAWGAFPD